MLQILGQKVFCHQHIILNPRENKKSIIPLRMMYLLIKFQLLKTPDIIEDGTVITLDQFALESRSDII